MSKVFDHRRERGPVAVDHGVVGAAPLEGRLDHVGVRGRVAEFTQRPVGADVTDGPRRLADDTGESRGVVASAEADEVAALPVRSPHVRAGAAEV